MTIFGGYLQCMDFLDNIWKTTTTFSSVRSGNSVEHPFLPDEVNLFIVFTVI